jgi:hypothetical protein
MRKISKLAVVLAIAAGSLGTVAAAASARSRPRRRSPARRSAARRTEFAFPAPPRRARNDPVYARLRLWQFSGRGGRLGPGKLSTLPQLGIEAIYLNYQVTTITDRYSNMFRYQARIVSSNPRVWQVRL